MQPDTEELDRRLTRLSWKCWLSLLVGMPLIGSLIAFTGLLAAHLYHLGDVATFLAQPNLFPSILGQLKFVVLISFVTNLCGALSLLAIFAVRDRLRP